MQFSSFQKYQSNFLQLYNECKKGTKRHEAFTPHIKGQCAFLIDFKEKIVTNHYGVQDLLGHTNDQFIFDNLWGFVHATDVEILTRLVYAVADYAAHHQYTTDVALKVVCRIRKSDGCYIQILAQSAVYFKDNDSNNVSYYTQLTDISFMNLGNGFTWKFEAPALHEEKFKDYVNPNIKNVFSNREMDVLALINKGLTSNAIAAKLFVSKHTIDTHRRKMLKKTGCTNSVDLILYYHKNYF